MPPSPQHASGGCDDCGDCGDDAWQAAMEKWREELRTIERARSASSADVAAWVARATDRSTAFSRAVQWYREFAHALTPADAAAWSDADAELKEATHALGAALAAQAIREHRSDVGLPHMIVDARRAELLERLTWVPRTLAYARNHKLRIPKPCHVDTLFSRAHGERQLELLDTYVDPRGCRAVFPTDPENVACTWAASAADGRCSCPHRRALVWAWQEDGFVSRSESPSWFNVDSTRPFGHLRRAW